MLLSDLKLIAGPCSAESYEQLRSIASSLQQFNLFGFRAGIWKPRTKPGSFEGIGELGLSWLQEIQNEFGIDVITEVASPMHVEQCLKKGFKKVWIGARTTSNPFSVQELAESLQGTGLTVLIKNPMNPDLHLWIGGIERLKKMGMNNIIAVHRGFSTYDKQKYRNLPNWQIPIALRSAMPDLEIICDPSHISGVAQNVPQVAQKAIDLKFDGLMIEVHNNPNIAKTDAKQQLNIEQFSGLISALKIRSRDEIDHDDLLEIRAQLSVLDEQLAEILAKRMDCSDQIGEYKKRNHIAIFQSGQWEESLRKFLSLAQATDLDPIFAAEIFKLIHQASIDRQSKVFNNTNE